MSWHLGRLAAFDLETTSPDPETARIVTAAVTLVGGGQDAEPRTWLVNPGVPIPDEAAAIHGITTEHAAAHGQPASEAAEEIAALIAQQLTARVPVVAMNARYDCTVLDRECRRHGVPTVLDRTGGLRGPVIDPFVIDKAVDRYRRGKRTLVALCEHYGVPLGDDAHEAGADALAAARVAYNLAMRFPELQRMPLADLFAAQERWAHEQAVSLQEYLRRKDPSAVCETAWPLIPHQTREEA